MCVLSVVAVSGDSYVDVLGNERTCNINEINQNMQKFLSESESTQGQGPQFILRPPVQMNVFEGEPLTLRCIVEGSPRPIGIAMFCLWYFYSVKCHPTGQKLFPITEIVKFLVSFIVRVGY